MDCEFPLSQGWANFFCTTPDNKSFRVLGPARQSCVTTAQFCCSSVKRAKPVCKWMNVAPIKHYLQKQTVGQIQLVGCSLETLSLACRSFIYFFNPSTQEKAWPAYLFLFFRVGFAFLIGPSSYYSDTGMSLWFVEVNHFTEWEIFFFNTHLLNATMCLVATYLNKLITCNSGSRHKMQK